MKQLNQLSKREAQRPKNYRLLYPNLITGMMINMINAGRTEAARNLHLFMMVSRMVGNDHVISLMKSQSRSISAINTRESITDVHQAVTVRTARKINSNLVMMTIVIEDEDMQVVRKDRSGHRNVARQAKTQKVVKNVILKKEGQRLYLEA